MDREKFIFRSFLRTLPEFAGEPIKEWDVVEEWYANRNVAAPASPLDKRPDIICLTAMDKKIGLEMKSWLNEEQIAEARRHEEVQDRLLRAIGDQGPNKTRHIGFIWLSPKQVRFDRKDSDRFREEMFALIEQIDRAWSAKEQCEQEHNQIVNDLSAFPVLNKYLTHVDFYPDRRGKRNIRWITFPARGGHYNPRRMRDTLRVALLEYRSDRRYEGLARIVGLQELYLLVHYDFNAFAYNHPFDEPGFGFKDVAEFAAGVLGGDGGNFDRIFLFCCLQGQEEVYRIC
jgi:hypothetical protein